MDPRSDFISIAPKPPTRVSSIALLEEGAEAIVGVGLLKGKAEGIELLAAEIGDGGGIAAATDADLPVHAG